MLKIISTPYSLSTVRTEWSDWSSCSTSCNGGSRWQYRNVTVYYNTTHHYTKPEYRADKCNEQPCALPSPATSEFRCCSFRYNVKTLVTFIKVMLRCYSFRYNVKTLVTFIKVMFRCKK